MSVSVTGESYEIISPMAPAPVQAAAPLAVAKETTQPTVIAAHSINDTTLNKSGSEAVVAAIGRPVSLKRLKSKRAVAGPSIGSVTSTAEDLPLELSSRVSFPAVEAGVSSSVSVAEVAQVVNAPIDTIVPWKSPEDQSILAPHEVVPASVGVAESRGWEEPDPLSSSAVTLPSELTNATCGVSSYTDKDGMGDWEGIENNPGIISGDIIQGNNLNESAAIDADSGVCVLDGSTLSGTAVAQGKEMFRCLFYTCYDMLNTLTDVTSILASPAFDKYRMLRSKLSDGKVRKKMIADGLADDIIELFMTS